MKEDFFDSLQPELSSLFNEFGLSLKYTDDNTVIETDKFQMTGDEILKFCDNSIIQVPEPYLLDVIKRYNSSEYEDIYNVSINTVIQLDFQNNEYTFYVGIGIDDECVQWPDGWTYINPTLCVFGEHVANSLYGLCTAIQDCYKGVELLKKPSVWRYFDKKKVVMRKINMLDDKVTEVFDL